jgi:hypothetical protein
MFGVAAQQLSRAMPRVATRSVFIISSCCFRLHWNNTDGRRRENDRYRLRLALGGSLLLLLIVGRENIHTDDVHPFTLLQYLY